MLKKQFKILEKLGFGTYSKVYKVKRLTDGQFYALKKVRMPNLSKKEKVNALNEVRILASLNSPHVISYKEAFYDDSLSSLCIVMDYQGGGDLLQKIQLLKKENSKFSEQIAWRYMIQMLRGLECLHDLKILHRDLKCANVFISSDNKSVALGDMNVSKIAKKEFVTTQTGTPYYASPEVWKDKPYGKKSDIWSLGCVFYEMLAQNPPFKAKTMEGLYKRVIKGRFKRIPRYYSEDLQNIIKMMIQIRPGRRPNCKELLQHELFQNHMHVLNESVEEVVQTQQDIINKCELIKTIKLPRNLKALTKILPKPNYKSCKPNQVSKIPFIGKQIVSKQIVKEPVTKESVIKKPVSKKPIVKKPVVTNEQKKDIHPKPTKPKVKKIKSEIISRKNYLDVIIPKKKNENIPDNNQRQVPKSGRIHSHRDMKQEEKRKRYAERLNKRPASEIPLRELKEIQKPMRRKYSKSPYQKRDIGLPRIYRIQQIQPRRRREFHYNKMRRVRSEDAVIVQSRQIGGNNENIPMKYNNGRQIKQPQPILYRQYLQELKPMKNRNRRGGQQNYNQNFLANRGKNILSNNSNNYILQRNLYLNQQQHHDIFGQKQYSPRPYIKRQYGKLSGLR